MLSELDITIEKPKAIKSQALVDLLNYSKQVIKFEKVLAIYHKQENWVLYFDGASSNNEVVLERLYPMTKEKILRKLSHWLFHVPIIKLSMKL